MNTVHLLIEAWPIAVLVVGLMVTVGVALYRLAQVERRADNLTTLIQEIEMRKDKDIRNLKSSIDERLFLHGGELRYVTSTLCGNMRESCGVHITENFSALNTKLAQMEVRWEKVLERLAGGFNDGSK